MGVQLIRIERNRDEKAYIIMCLRKYALKKTVSSYSNVELTQIKYRSLSFWDGIPSLEISNYLKLETTLQLPPTFIHRKLGKKVTEQTTRVYSTKLCADEAKDHD